MGRAPCCDKANVKKGPWSPEEDAKLKNFIEKNGTGGNWIALPQKAGLKRCGKSCRLRWLNYLRPDIRHGGFTEEEDKIICSLYAAIGSRWSIIAAQLPGRTDNDIKNYWNTRLKKKLLGNRKDHPQSHRLSRAEESGGMPVNGHYDMSAMAQLMLMCRNQEALSVPEPLRLLNGDPFPNSAMPNFQTFQNGTFGSAAQQKPMDDFSNFEKLADLWKQVQWPETETDPSRIPSFGFPDSQLTATVVGNAEYSCCSSSPEANCAPSPWVPENQQKQLHSLSEEESGQSQEISATENNFCWSSSKDSQDPVSWVSSSYYSCRPESTDGYVLPGGAGILDGFLQTENLECADLMQSAAADAAHFHGSLQNSSIIY